MRKFLSVIAFAIAAAALIIGGIVMFASLPTDGSVTIKNAGFIIGPAIGLLGSGIACAVGAIANFFTAKTKDK